MKQVQLKIEIKKKSLFVISTQRKYVFWYDQYYFDPIQIDNYTYFFR
jgi:hypothetical protein